MTRSAILAIDPGPVQSAWVVWDGRTVIAKGIFPNDKLLHSIEIGLAITQCNVPCTIHLTVIEMVACYGMPVGKEIFETVYWIGRFAQAAGPHDRVYRTKIKSHICHSGRAKDANVTQALVDRFASGESNMGKGTKKAPGFFHSFKSDIWQAFAVAVYWWDENGAQFDGKGTTEKGDDIDTRNSTEDRERGDECAPVDDRDTAGACDTEVPGEGERNAERCAGEADPSETDENERTATGGGEDPFLEEEDPDYLF